MRSALAVRLTPDARQALTDDAIEKLRRLRSEMEGSEWYQKREKFERVAASKFDHRKSGQPEAQTIFDRSNQSLQIVRSVRRFLLARIAKDLFGSSPWYSVKPEGPMDQVLAEQIYKHSDWKLRAAAYKPKAKEALGVAFDLGECALKTTWKVDEDSYERIATILVGPDGKPVVGEDGEYFYDTDEASNAEEMGGDEGMEVPTPSFAIDTEQPIPVRVFAKDPTVPLPTATNGFKWDEQLIEEKTRLYSGLKITPIYWKDLVWEINRPCIDEGDVFHTYDATLEELRAQFNPDGSNKEVQAMLDLISEQAPGPKAQAGQPRQHHGESGTSTWWDQAEKGGPIKVTECFLRRNINGRMSRIWMVLIEEESICLWVDYIATISPRSKCPIHLVPINKVAGRAYGRGLYEVFEMAAEAVDKLVNGILYRNSYNNDPVKVWNPHAVEGTEVDPNLRLGPGKTYKVKTQQTKASDILQLIEIPDLDSRTWQLMELFMQLIQVESGVTNANQGDVSDLPTNTTATGINSMLESSSVLHFFVLEEAREGLTPQLCYSIELIYFWQDEDETFEYMEGDAAGVLSLADAEKLKKLAMNVEILLSRARRAELREAALAAIPRAVEFFTLLANNPDAAMRLRPLWIQALRGLDIDGADQMLPTAAEIEAQIQALQQQQQAVSEAGAAAPTGEDGTGASTEPPPPSLPDNVIPDDAEPTDESEAS